MYKLTKKLLSYCKSRWGFRGDRQALRKMVNQKMLAGKIDLNDIKAINAGTKKAGVKAAVGSGVGKGAKKKTTTDDNDPPARRRTTKTKTRLDKSASRSSNNTADEIQSIVDKAVAKATGGRRRRNRTGSERLSASRVLSRSATARVVEAATQYSKTREIAKYPEFVGAIGDKGKHPLAGRQARYCGQPIILPSARDKAIAQAWLKSRLSARPLRESLPRGLRMTDHDRELIHYGLRNVEWSGMFKGANGMQYLEREKLQDFQIKTLLDDTISGGIEITPTAFDDNIIMYPVLFGELFPWVTVEETKSRRVKGGKMLNPEFQSGPAEGTEIQPFDTAAFFQGFDTPIFAATSAVELGRDFEDDTPILVADKLMEAFGMKAMQWLDQKIAVGNGTTEPLGLFYTPTATESNSSFGLGGPLTANDFEGLYFALAKEYRNEPGAALAYVSNDSLYAKSRSIPRSVLDQQRLFGMTHGDYLMLNRPHKISDRIPAGWLAFVNLKRYRLYRRLGMDIRIDDTGRYNTLNNTRVIAVRMRWGGQMELGSAVSFMKDCAI